MRVSCWGSCVLAIVLVCGIAQVASAAKSEKEAVVTAAPSPSEQHRALVDALIANDVEAFALQFSGESQEKLAQEWERDRLRKANAEHPPYIDVELERIWALLGTPEGTAQLGEELYPKFAEQASLNVAQLNGGIAMTLASIASDGELSPEEVQQLSQLMLAVQRWSNGMDWQDRVRFDRALDEIAGFARRSHAKTFTEIMLLPYEDALALGDDAIATAKRVLRVYDLDVDATLRSARIEELSREGDDATLRWSARVLDVPVTITRALRYERKYANRWRDAKELEQEARWQADYEAAEDAREAETAKAVGTSSDAGTATCSQGESNPDAKDQFWTEAKQQEGRRADPTGRSD